VLPDLPPAPARPTATGRGRWLRSETQTRQPLAIKSFISARALRNGPVPRTPENAPNENRRRKFFDLFCDWPLTIPSTKTKTAVASHRNAG
jgi:hypothetical protein